MYVHIMHSSPAIQSTWLVARARAPPAPATPALAGTTVVFYYEDSASAAAFYETTLGFKVLSRGNGRLELQLAGGSTFVLAGAGWASEAGHLATQPQTTALALITDQLDGW